MSLLLSRRPGAARVVRVRPATVPDSYGESVRTVWDERASRAVLPRAVVQERGSADNPEPGTPARISSDRVLFVPGVADVEEGDRIEVDGEPWRIDGLVQVKRGVGARSTFTTAALTRVTGA